jgi:hypothetical protein
MLYCVSYANGAVGVFSSLDKVTELVFNKYPSVTFITQVFKSSEDIDRDEGKHIAWIIMYKDSESFAYVSDNKKAASNAMTIFDKIGKAYEEIVDLCEQEVDVVSECVAVVLDSLQTLYGESEFVANSIENIIYYV